MSLRCCRDDVGGIYMVLYSCLCWNAREKILGLAIYICQFPELTSLFKNELNYKLKRGYLNIWITHTKIDEVVATPR